MRRPPAVGQRYPPVLRATMLRAWPGRRRRRFPQDHRAADRARAWPIDPRPAAGEVGLFTTDLDAGELALFEQLRQLARGSRPAPGRHRPSGDIPVPRSRIGWCRDPRFVRPQPQLCSGSGSVRIGLGHGALPGDHGEDAVADECGGIGDDQKPCEGCGPHGRPPEGRRARSLRGPVMFR